MRDYPTVPNVFRVASSHSVNTDCTTSGGISGCDIKITSGTNANLPTGQLRQQQQHQQKQQQPNGNISGQQQSLVKSSISSQTTTKTTTATTTQSASTTAAATTTAATTFSTILKTSTTHQHQQQQQKNKNDCDFIMQNHNSLQVQPQSQSQHPHKLTTHASIERPQCLQRTTQSYLQQSPYATLPRKPTTSLSTLSLLSANANTITDTDIRKQQHHQQQQRHNSTSNSNNNNSNNSNNNSHNNSNNKTHKNSTNDPTMLGVINTISGSIPATGYTNSNGGSNIGHRTISMGSDLNIGSSMNNSCTNLSKLNGVQQQQQQQQKQVRLQQQQQQSSFQHRDFKQTAPTIDDFTTYRRQYPCSSLERSTNGYLWIITPVAAR